MWQLKQFRREIDQLRGGVTTITYDTTLVLTLYLYFFFFVIVSALNITQ